MSFRFETDEMFLKPESPQVHLKILKKIRPIPEGREMMKRFQAFLAGN